MKQLFRYISVVVMLFTSMAVSAQSTIKVMTITNGTVTTDKNSASKNETVTITVTPSEGYYFPTDYSVEAVNGVSVTRDSYTKITVSGTPTADAEITLTAPTAKTTPEAPTAAAVNCTTADDNDGKLTKVTTAMEYKKSDATSWTAVTDSNITGLEPGTYYLTAFSQGGDFKGDNTFELYAVTSEGEQVDPFKLTSYIDWKNPTIPEIKVNDGKLTIGVRIKSNPTSWGTVDNFALYRIGD